MGSSSSSIEFVGAVETLQKGQVKLDDHDVWKIIFTCHFSELDLANAIQATSVRHLRRYQPSSLAVLLYKCTEQISIFVEHRNASKVQSVSNSIRILGRVMPFVLEHGEVEEHDKRADAYMVQQNEKESSTSAAAAAGNGEEEMRERQLSDEAASEGGHGSYSKFAKNFAELVLLQNSMCLAGEDEGKTFPGMERKEDGTFSPCLAELMVSSLVSAAFVRGYTIGDMQLSGLDAPSGHPYVDPGILWCSGICNDPNAPIHWSEVMTTHRRKLLETLIHLMSAQIYMENPLMPDNYFRQRLVDLKTVPQMQSLVCSCVNLIFTYDPSGAIPFSSHIITGMEELVQLSARFMSLLLDYVSFLPSQQEEEENEDQEADKVVEEKEGEGGGVERSPSETISATESGSAVSSSKSPSKRKGKSIFRNHAVWSFFEDCSPAECERILRGLLKFIGNPVMSKSSRIPGSQRYLLKHEEFFILFWKLMDRLPNFLKTLATTKLSHQYIIPILDFGMGARENAADMPKLQLVAFMLIRLTALRDFVVQCNENCTQWIPYQLPLFHGTFNDLILLSMHSLIVQRHKWLQPIQESCSIIMSNITPYMTTVSSTSAQKLTNLLEMCSRPQWLEGSTTHCNILIYVIECFADLLQYQFSGCGHLCYSLVRSAEAVRRLYDAVAEDEVQLTDVQKEKLFIGTVQCAVDALESQVKTAFEADPNLDPVYMASKITLVGELPFPHHIVTRRFESRPSTDAWLVALLWGYIYVHHGPHPFADPRAVKLFQPK